jgi:glucose-1-phosphate thymidylyltransferase
METAQKRETGAAVFGYWVKGPHNYGVAEFPQDNKVVSVEGKPLKP